MISTPGLKDKLVYFVVNKPKGFICSNEDGGKQGKRVIDLLQPWLDKWAKDNQNNQV